MASSGSAVFFAGGTVVLALAALVLTGVSFLASIGLATSIVVLFAVATALTLLPAVLTLLGNRIDKGRLGRRAPSAKATKPAEATSWWRLAHRISARPWPYLLIGSLLLLTLAVPALSLKTGWPDAGDSTSSTSERQAYDLLADGFGPGINSPLLVVADLRDTGLAVEDITGLARDIAADRGVAQVEEPAISADGDTVVLSTRPTTAPADPATAQTLERIRTIAPEGVHVTGVTAMTLDLNKQLSDTLPLFIGGILVAAFLLLVLVFRSVVVPLNMFMATAFPRIREAYLTVGDNTEAVARGLAATGRVITSGALIMMCVFLAFVANPDPFTKMIGLGLATAVLVDATVVRMILVPATMALMGRANWWLPGWLDRLLPHLSLETGPVVHLPSQEQTPVTPTRTAVEVMDGAS